MSISYTTISAVYYMQIYYMHNHLYIDYLQSLLYQNHIPFTPQQHFHPQLLNNTLTNTPPNTLTNTTPLHINIQQPLTAPLIQRYSRQMLLKEIAYEGQKNIVQCKIGIVGAGGIGCPLAMYLSAAGVGTIGLFDSDRVEVSNLHRQIGHRSSRIGTPKTKSLKSTILEINPHIIVEEHPFVTVQNVTLLDGYDLVIDGSDNPMCRYIVNDYCMKTNRRLLSGACIGWEAQITCYGAQQACYRCLWGDEQVSMGGCSVLGVIGMLPGIVGLILAVEALKLITTSQSSLSGRLLTYDARKCEFKKMKLRKKHKDCLACGSIKLDMQEYDYGKYNRCAKNSVPESPQATWQQFISSEKEALLDVRPSNHYQIVHLLNSINIPWQNLSQLSKGEILERLKLQQREDKCISVCCTRGVMSKHATRYLSEMGLKAVSLQGGLLKYKALFDERIPQL